MNTVCLHLSKPKSSIVQSPSCGNYIIHKHTISFPWQHRLDTGYQLINNVWCCLSLSDDPGTDPEIFTWGLAAYIIQCWFVWGGWGGVGWGGWLAMIEVLPLWYVQMEVASHPHPTPHPISPCDPIIIMKWFGMKVRCGQKDIMHVYHIIFYQHEF